MSTPWVMQHEPTLRLRLRNWWWLKRARMRRMVPRLVWIGQEIDVIVTFKEDRLRPVVVDPNNPTEAMRQLMEGALPQMRRSLAEIGIEFDTGMGPGGRDWEWDWSLRGPISVRFQSVCKTADKRR